MLNLLSQNRKYLQGGAKNEVETLSQILKVEVSVTRISLFPCENTLVLVYC